MKHLIILLTLTAASTWATPLGDALTNCLTSSSTKNYQVTVKKIPIDSEDEAFLGIQCSPDTSKKIYTLLMASGADYQDTEFQQGTVRVINLGYGLKSGLHSACYKFLEGRQGNDVNRTPYCILAIDLSPGLVSNLDLAIPKKDLKETK